MDKYTIKPIPHTSFTFLFIVSTVLAAFGLLPASIIYLLLKGVDLAIAALMGHTPIDLSFWHVYAALAIVFMFRSTLNLFVILGSEAKRVEPK